MTDQEEVSEKLLRAGEAAQAVVLCIAVSRTGTTLTQNRPRRGFLLHAEIQRWNARELSGARKRVL